MDILNYRHLYYFWMTAKTGSITAATGRLGLAQPTLSLQLGQLEKVLGKRLFLRSRKGISLTPEGRVAVGYAEKIFAQGEALVRALSDVVPPAPPILRVGMDPALSQEVALWVLDSIQRAAGANTALFSAEPSLLRKRLSRWELDLTVSASDLAAGLGKDFQSRLMEKLPVYLLAVSGRSDSFSTLIRSKNIPLLIGGPENPIRREVQSIWFACRARLQDGSPAPDILRQVMALRLKSTRRMR